MLQRQAAECAGRQDWGPCWMLADGQRGTAWEGGRLAGGRRGEGGELAESRDQETGWACGSGWMNRRARGWGALNLLHGHVAAGQGEDWGVWRGGDGQQKGERAHWTDCMDRLQPAWEKTGRWRSSMAVTWGVHTATSPPSGLMKQKPTVAPAGGRRRMDQQRSEGYSCPEGWLVGVRGL